MLIVNGWLSDLIPSQSNQFNQAGRSARSPAPGQRARTEGSGTMDDDLAGLVCQAVHRLEEAYGRINPRGKSWPLDVLLGHVRDEVAGIATAAPDDLAVVVAVCWLGPLGPDIPPAPMRAELLQIVRHYVPAFDQRLDRILEFAIAYGCGKWRPVSIGHGTWQQRWERAIDELTDRAILPWVEEANQWLAIHLPGFPIRTPEQLWSDADLLGQILLTPTATPLQGQGRATMTIACDPGGATLVAGRYRSDVPAGAKFVFEVPGGAMLRVRDEQTRWPAGTKIIILARDDDTWITAFQRDAHGKWVKAGDLPRVTLNHWEIAEVTVAGIDFVVWECTCGHHECDSHHRLERWDPGNPRVTLWSFGASAVKGLPNVQTGSFPQGMYFALLAKERF